MAVMQCQGKRVLDNRQGFTPSWEHVDHRWIDGIKAWMSRSDHHVECNNSVMLECQVQAAASQLVTVSSIRAAALAATSPERLLWGEVGGKADHPSQAKAQCSFLTKSAFFFFLYLHAQVMPSPRFHTKPSCRHQRDRSFLSVCHTLPEVNQSGLRVPAGPDGRWGPRERWNPGIQHHK